MTLGRSAPAVVMAVIVAACSTTGGTIGGLVPAPKFLKGQIKDNIYYAPNNVLRVAVPFLKGTYEFTYMRVKEQFDGNAGLIIFGPAAFDQGVYRVEVLTQKDGLETIEAFNADAPILMQETKEMLRREGRASLEDLGKDDDPINGRPTRHEKVRQHARAGVLSNRPEVLTYDLFLVQFGKKVAVAMIMRPEKSVADPPAISVAAFAQSVQVP
jgi:hypothetical protein